MSAGEQLVWQTLSEALARPPRLTVSQWSEAYRILPRETTRQHGPWRNDRVPFAVEIMDTLSAHDRTEVTALMKGAQIAGTEIGLNALGYWIEHDPSAILVVCPTIPDARKFSRRRLRPLIISTPALKARVEEERSRDAASNTLYREFPGGAIILVGANAPGGLAGNPVRRLFFDDADSCTAEIGEEGDPLYLAEVRTTTFPNRKVYVNGTPKIEGESRIERLFLRGDQRRYYVPCPSCGRFDFLTWTGYANFSDLEDGGHYRIAWEEGRPETAHCVCPGCGAQISEAQKDGMFARGQWRATAQGDGRTASFHLSGLYSPHGWLSWAEVAREFLEVKNDPVALKGWVNLRLGETWRRHQDALKPQRLLGRFERWEAEVPVGVGALVAAADVQDYGLVYLVVGYGAGEESWVIEYGEIHGDPAKEGVWRELDRVRETKWQHVSGREVPIECMVVDSGGHHTHEVYEYCKPRYSRRVWAIRGGNDPRADLVSRASRKNQGGVLLWTLGVDTGKDTIHSRLKIETAGPGCIHIPRPDHEHGRWLWANSEFAAQLASEVMVRKRDPRRGWTRAWKQVRDRNEAWDLSVYCLAALRIRGPALLRELATRAKALAEPPPDAGAEPEPEGPTPAPTPRPRGFAGPRRGWVRGW